MFIESVNTEVTDEAVYVYNFQVEGMHTYYVSDECILVHNADGNYSASIDSESGSGSIQTKELENHSVTYRRVQGGTPPNASQIRIYIDDNGKISIPNKKLNLNISTGSDEHAKYFLSKRSAGAEIVEFEVPDWFDDFLKENAISQKGYRNNPLNQKCTVPKVVDPTKPGTSYELPAPWIEWLEEYSSNGRIVKK